MDDDSKEVGNLIDDAKDAYRDIQESLNLIAKRSELIEPHVKHSGDVLYAQENQPDITSDALDLVVLSYHLWEQSMLLRDALIPLADHMKGVSDQVLTKDSFDEVTVAIRQAHSEDGVS